MQCAFCKIIKREMRADILFENSSCIVFIPLNLITKGHVIVASKKHFENIFDINTKILAEVVSTVQRFARDIIKKQKCTGINLLHASGEDAQQSVPHFHLHLVPRHPNDGLDLWFKNNL